METHVKVLGALNIVFGAVSLCAALVLVLVFGGVAGALVAEGDADVAVALPIIGLTGLALVFFLVVLSLPGIVIGIGLWRRLPWARIAGIVLAILSLFVIPFGTIVGVYGLWVLFSSETERLFAARGTSPL